MQRTPALFVADSLGLDFLNSIATLADVPVDWIEGGDGLLAWLDQAGLASPATLASVREQALPGELDAVSAQARELREDFRNFVSEHKGRPLEADALAELEPLNRLLARDEGYLRLAVAKDGARPAFELRPMRRWRSADSLLLPIAEALARLVAEEDFTDVKACEGLGCTLLFADHTRGRVRRWCAMAICGNRAKQAAHRSRAKQGRGTADA